MMNVFFRAAKPLKMKKLLILPLLLMILLSCERNRDTDDRISPDAARDTLFSLMHEMYYWYRQMPVVDKSDYSDPYTLLEAMRYKPVDRFSFVADYDEYKAQMEGSFVGHGIRVRTDNEGRARISMIYDKSPLFAEGVRRGWTILKLNGVDIGALLVAGNRQAYNNAFGPAKEGVTNTFLFRKPDGTIFTIRSAKAAFQTNSVLLYDTLHLTSGITGHLVYESFIEPSEKELTKVFQYFTANNVKDLILDLRYNPGGLVNLSRKLSSYIAGNNVAGKILAKLEYNDQHEDFNHIFTFITTVYPLNLGRVVVITTRSTASASEFIINGLRPHISVITVGDTTYGKPVGYNAWDVGRKYVFAPTTFKIVNSLGQGEYYFGIPPDKAAPDDVTRDFNDRREASLKEAIYYLEHGNVSTKGLTRFRNNPQYSEHPEWRGSMVVERNK
jgi:C-terminal processing protease CtpA/Prc